MRRNVTFKFQHDYRTFAVGVYKFSDSFGDGIMIAVGPFFLTVERTK